MDYKKIMDSLFKENFELEQQRDQFKAERNSLIDDLSWYKAKVSRLERELASALNGELIKYDELQEYVLELQSELMKCQKEYEKLNNTAEEALDIAESENCKVQRLEHKNEKLRKAHYNGWKQKDEVINNLISNIKSKDNFLSEISQHIGNKPSSSTYKYFRAKLDDIGIKEGE
ncbi:hypothetical protein [Staphylococcus saprophyticus]|uniref:hypothetical protein n=1 Tax=Staphylococcus saprophyticus TaxID=29385 RepID=UPI0009907610|nr:hypothetical protein [Staphylococcus saprophyticus]OOO72394.1 hypothetical protein B0W56_00465 [Staphylococcus saprophyticus]